MRSRGGRCRVRGQSKKLPLSRCKRDIRDIIYRTEQRQTGNNDVIYKNKLYQPVTICSILMWEQVGQASERVSRGNPQFFHGAQSSLIPQQLGAIECHEYAPQIVEYILQVSVREVGCISSFDDLVQLRMSPCTSLGSRWSALRDWCRRPHWS